MIYILLGIVLIIATLKWFIYYCTVRGLLYYIADKHFDMLEADKTKELTRMAVERTIKEFFGQV